MESAVVPVSHWSVRKMPGSACVLFREKTFNVAAPAGWKPWEVSTTRESLVRQCRSTSPDTRTVRTSFPVSVSKTAMLIRWSPMLPEPAGLVQVWSRSARYRPSGLVVTLLCVLNTTLLSNNTWGVVECSRWMAGGESRAWAQRTDPSPGLRATPAVTPSRLGTSRRHAISLPMRVGRAGRESSEIAVETWRNGPVSVWTRAAAVVSAITGSSAAPNRDMRCPLVVGFQGGAEWVRRKRGAEGSCGSPGRIFCW